MTIFKSVCHVNIIYIKLYMYKLFRVVKKVLYEINITVISLVGLQKMHSWEKPIEKPNYLELNLDL